MNLLITSFLRCVPKAISVVMPFLSILRRWESRATVAGEEALLGKKLCYSKWRCVSPFSGCSLRQPQPVFYEPARRLRLLKTSESQLFCTNCGKNMEDSPAGFCPDCGAPTGAVRDDFRDDFAENPGASGSARLMVPWRGGQVALGLLYLVIGAFILLVSILLLIMSIILLRTGDLKQALELTGDLNPALAAWASSVLLGLVILLVVWYLGLRPTRGSVALLGLRATSIPAGGAILWTIGVLVSSFGATLLYSFIMEKIGADWLLPPESYTEIVWGGPAVVLTFMALALWTPFTEELFFRGFVFAGLVRRRGVAGALVSSAMIFSAFHLLAGPGVLVPIFITGFLLAWLYYHTGSLWPGIAAHAGGKVWSAKILLPTGR